MNQKKESKLFNIISSLVSVIVILLFLVFKGLNYFVWNECYFSVPFLLFCVVIFIVSFTTELKKNVRIYSSLSGVEFVKGKISK